MTTNYSMTLLIKSEFLGHSGGLKESEATLTFNLKLNLTAVNGQMNSNRQIHKTSVSNLRPAKPRTSFILLTSIYSKSSQGPSYINSETRTWTNQQVVWKRQ